MEKHQHVRYIGDSTVSIDQEDGVANGYNVFQSREQILPPIKTHLDLENEKVPNAEPVPHHVAHPTRHLGGGSRFRLNNKITLQPIILVHLLTDSYRALYLRYARENIDYADTMLHLFRGNIGTGLLAMGDAFKNGGIVFAPVMTAILGIICVHAQHLLLKCSDEMYRQTNMEKPPGFADTVYLVFANGPVRYRTLASSVKMLVNSFLCITQLGFCCVYIVFIANNVKMICDQYNIHIELSIHMLFVVIPILLSCMVRNLKYLTPFSTVANIMMALGVAVVVYKASQDLPAVETRTYVASWQQLPLFFGTAIYAFEGIGLVLPLKNEMKRPELFQKPLGVLNVGMVVVGSIFITVGFLGYLKWGEDVMGSLTLNLESGKVLSNVVQGLIALSMVFTYPLQFYVPVGITWPAIRRKCGDNLLVVKEIGYRATLVMITFILAQAIPELGLFISLVGAISSTALALMFPPLIELVFRSQKKEGIPVYIWIKNIFIITLGLFIFITGTFESIASIIRAFKG